MCVRAVLCSNKITTVSNLISHATTPSVQMTKTTALDAPCPGALYNSGTFANVRSKNPNTPECHPRTQTGARGSSCAHSRCKETARTCGRFRFPLCLHFLCASMIHAELLVCFYINIKHEASVKQTRLQLR